jgi:hypothetical protein
VEMDEAAALAEARTRWPAQGSWVKYTPAQRRAPYSVGIVTVTATGRKRLRQMGCGLTWERAFLSADNRTAGRTAPRRRSKAKPSARFEQLSFLETR